MDVLSRYDVHTEDNKTPLKQNVIFRCLFVCTYACIVCHGRVVEGYTGSIIDRNTMTSLGRQLGGEGGW
jgi:hypothetical protein